MAEFGRAKQKRKPPAAGATDDAWTLPLNPTRRRSHSSTTTAQGAQNSWEVREAALGVSSHPPSGRDAYEGWEDAAVAPEKTRRVPCGTSAISSLSSSTRRRCTGTLGKDVCTSESILTSRATKELRSSCDSSIAPADLVVQHGGSISGETRRRSGTCDVLGKSSTVREIVEAFREFKAIWDPRKHDETRAKGD